MPFLFRLGLEGLVTFKKDQHTFDPEQYSMTLPPSATAPGVAAPAEGITLAVFDKVTVSISVVKDKNTQRGKVQMKLVHPVSSEGL
jgi:exosome complex exonuclease DIS3/RRP44